jgi:hypothetical protein
MLDPETGSSTWALFNGQTAELALALCSLSAIDHRRNRSSKTDRAFQACAELLESLRPQISLAVLRADAICNPDRSYPSRNCQNR